MNELIKNWVVQMGGDETFPFIVIDNWYDPDTEKSVWKELDFLSCVDRANQQRAENTVVARTKDGESLSRSYRWYPFQIYNKEYGVPYSPILNSVNNFRTPEFYEVIDKIKPQGRIWKSSNCDDTIISYYENNDYYKPHWDKFLWTSLIWFYREPKQFTGGDFTLTERGYKIDLKHNRMFMFPCYSLHEVSPVKFKKLPKEMGFGRYTITHFWYSA